MASLTQCSDFIGEAMKPRDGVDLLLSHRESRDGAGPGLMSLCQGSSPPPPGLAPGGRREGMGRGGKNRGTNGADRHT